MFAYNKKYRIDPENPFIDSERFSPVAYGMDLPNEGDPYHIPIDQVDSYTLKNSIIDHAWWEEQKRRCYLGYRVPHGRKDGSDVIIHGRHYFYLNFWWIYGKEVEGKIKKLIKPRFIDLDYQQAWQWQTMITLGKDDLDYKARQKGFSEKVAGIMLGYNFTFYPDSENLIIAGQQSDADRTFGNTKRGLDKLINTQFYKQRKRGGDSSDYLEAKYYGSKIISLTAKDNPQTASRFSPSLVVLEEGGKWSYGMLRSVKGFIQPSIENEGTRTGNIIIIGTSGDMEAGAADLEYFYNNPVEENILDFEDKNEAPEDYVPGKRVGGFISRNIYTIMDKNGNSLIEESKKYHKQKEEKCKTDKELYLYKVNNPQYASEGFSMIGGGFFDKRIITAANAQKNIIKRSSDLNIIREGHWEWEDPSDWSKGAYFKDGPNKFGIVTSVIVETPNELDTYAGSIDSFDRNEANTSDSKGSMSVYKEFKYGSDFSDTWICRLFFRPDAMTGGAPTFYEETIKVAIAYKLLEKTLVEYSNLRIFDFYEKKGMESLLQLRPDFVISNMVDNSKVSNKYGIDPSTKPMWLSKLNDYLLGKDGDCMPVLRILDPFILDRIIRFRYEPKRGGFNDDTIITMALNIIQREETILEIEHTNYSENNKFTFSSHYKSFNPYARQ